MKVNVPVSSEELAQELVEFWGDVFGRPSGRSSDVLKEALLGSKQEHHRQTVYLERRGQKLAGACLLIISKRVPILGAFGKTATAPEFRRMGISSDLCAQAVEDFRSSGGEALFLGTNHPNAARIYYRLGYRMLPGGITMANITNGDSPEAFLVDYFRGLSAATIMPATPADEIAALPLQVSPHDWQVLDANAGILSTRYCRQRTTRGLFSRYPAVAGDGRGACFSARSTEGGVVGLATARLDDIGGCRVDGFAHKYFLESWDGLIKAAMDWGASQGTDPCWASVSVEDEEKRALFERLGFRNVGSTDEFDLDGRAVASVRMEIP